MDKSWRSILLPLFALLLLLGLLGLLAMRNVEALHRIEDGLRERASISNLTTVNAIRGVARYGPDKEERVEAVLEEVARTPGVVAVELYAADGRRAYALGEAEELARRFDGLDEANERFASSTRFELQDPEPCCSHAQCAVDSCHPPSQLLMPGEYALWMSFDARSAILERRQLFAESVILAALFALLSAISIALFLSLRRNTTLSRRLALDAQKRDGLERLGLLAGGLAHEIRNPLGAIRGLTQLLHERAEEPEERENTALMLTELDRVGERLEEFLSFARKRRLDWQAVELRALLKEVMTLLAADARASDVDLRLEPGQGQTVWADPGQLKELFINLLLNALQACEPDGGEVVVSVAASRERVEVCVEDDGHGIPEELLERVFDPYFSTRTEGTGLGLAIARRITEDHGASLQAEQRSPRGARFRVSFDPNVQQRQAEPSLSA
ncbi:MAG: ATP-binding protein [Myxococcota bacterium]|nr:ATP-binding protein [Myxococcota bacterium]